MRSCQRALTTTVATLLALGLLAQVASAQVEPRPLVFLAIDDSGSMEYTLRQPSASTPVPVPECPTTPPADYVYEKNRWLMIAETLTGSFEGLSCTYDPRTDSGREDFGYPVPHVDWAWTIQNDDGLLDQVADAVTFGFATYDVVLSQSSGANGDFSFFYTAPDGTGPGGENVDIGIQNRSAARGPLVDPVVTEIATEVQVGNALVQQSILSMLPHGGGPTGQALFDIVSYMENAPAMNPVGPGNPQGDAYLECRQRYVVLITDGAPTEDGLYGYPTAVENAQRLWTEFGVRVFVVAFAIDEVVDRVALDDIAFFGGTSRSYVAVNAVHLRSILRSLITRGKTTVETRTRPAITNATQSTDAYNKQFRFYGARSPIEGNPVDMRGLLEQEVWGCGVDCVGEGRLDAPGVCEVLDLGEVLNDRTEDRAVYTVVKDLVSTGTYGIEPFLATNTDLTYEVMAIDTTQSEYPQVALWAGQLGWELPFGHLIGELPSGVMDPTLTQADKLALYREQLFDYVLAGPVSRRFDNRLGAIFNSNPTVGPPPPYFLSSLASYRFYALERNERPTMLYVATHEGLLHAFRVDRNPSLTRTEYGREAWAFMPGFALPRVQELDSGFSQILDGTPVFRESLPFRDDPNADPAVEKDSWRSLLVVPSGQNARGIFALDVTDPEVWTDDKFLWELTPEGRCHNQNGTRLCEPATVPDSDYSMMGHLVAKPVIGTVFFNGVNGLGEYTVVLVPGGDDPNGHGYGRSFYVINAMTGEKIMEFSDANGNVVGAALNDHPLVGVPRAYSPTPGSLVSRVFVGDAGGRMWRISMESSNPTDWVMSLFHDAYAPNDPTYTGRRPVRNEPSIALAQNGTDIVVVYNTGYYEDAANNQAHRVFSVTEDPTVTNGLGIENWRHEFEYLEVPVANTIIFGGAAFFSSYLLPQAPCYIGMGRFWGVDYDDDSTGEPVAAIDPDGNAYTIDDPILYYEYDETIPVGISLVKEPSCDLEDPYGGLIPPYLFDPNQGQGTGGVPAGAGGLRISMQEQGRTGASNPDQPPPGAPGSSESEIARSQGIAVAPPMNQVIIESWGIIFE